MAELHETRYGQRLFDHQIPELIKQLTRIANALEQLSRSDRFSWDDRNIQDISWSQIDDDWRKTVELVDTAMHSGMTTAEQIYKHLNHGGLKQVTMSQVREAMRGVKIRDQATDAALVEAVRISMGERNWTANELTEDLNSRRSGGKHDFTVAQVGAAMRKVIADDIKKGMMR